jgi:hypothetical protein
MGPDTPSNDFMATLIPHHFFTTPALWTGLVVAAAFLAARSGCAAREARSDTRDAC